MTDSETPTKPNGGTVEVQRGPIYAELARCLSASLYGLRMTLATMEDRLRAWGTARDCDGCAAAFEAWSVATTEEQKRHTIREWQTVKSTARELGLEVL